MWNKVKEKGKQLLYRPELSQRVDRGIALPFRGLGARVVINTTGRFTRRKDPLPFVQEAGWAPGPF
jgi:hypothetical protein